MLKIHDQSIGLKVLVDIALTSSFTARYSTAHTIVNDVNGVARFYEGRIVSDMVISEQIQGFDRPISTRASLTIELSNTYPDGTTGFFDDLLRTFNFFSKPVTVYVGDGDDLTHDYHQVYKGVIRFPHGIVRHDSDVFAIHVTDIQQEDDIILPLRKFDPNQYPLLEEKAKGVAIPYAYGDYGNIDIGGIKYPRIPAHCINTDTKEFKLSDTPIKSIDGLYRSVNGGLAHKLVDLQNTDIVLEDNFNDGDISDWTQESGTWSAATFQLVKTSNDGVSKIITKPESAFETGSWEFDFVVATATSEIVVAVMTGTGVNPFATEEGYGVVVTQAELILRHYRSGAPTDLITVEGEFSSGKIMLRRSGTGMWQLYIDSEPVGADTHDHTIHTMTHVVVSMKRTFAAAGDFIDNLIISSENSGGGRAYDYDSNDFSLLESTFKLNEYATDTDSITVDCKGICFGDDPTLGLIENPFDVIADLIVNRAGKPSSVLDGSSLDAYAIQFSDNFNNQSLSQWSGTIANYTATNKYLAHLNVAGPTNIYVAETTFDDMEFSVRVKHAAALDGRIVGFNFFDSVPNGNGYSLKISVATGGGKYHQSGGGTEIRVLLERELAGVSQEAVKEVNLDYDSDWHTYGFTRKPGGIFELSVDGVKFLGNTNNVFTSIAFLQIESQHPSVHIDDIVVAGKNLSTIKTSFDSVRCRRLIDTPITLSQLLADITFETGIILDTADGVYTAADFYPDQVWPILPPDLYDDTDIISGSFRIQRDPQNVYTNKVIARYSFHPASTATEEKNKFLRVITNGDHRGILAVGATYEQVFDFKWLYQDNDVSDTVNAYLRFFGGTQPPEIVETSLGFRALRMRLNDIIRLTHSKYDEKECKIIGLSKNITTGITAANILVFPDFAHAGILSDNGSLVFPAHLGGGSIATYDTAWTPEQKRWAISKACYLTDDNGYVVTGDESTKDLWGLI